MAHLAPIDYRYALDAALTLLAGAQSPAVRCHAAALAPEARQRVPVRSSLSHVDAVLWVEPLKTGWHDEFRKLAAALPVDGRFVVLASRPLARLLPERRGWLEQPLGVDVGGLRRLHRVFTRSGYRLEASYGIHSPYSIVVSLVGQLLSRLGRADIGDRLHFAARSMYCITGPLALGSTVALQLWRKEQTRC